MMHTLYSIAGWALTPLIRSWLTRRAKRGKEDAARMGERFGYASAARPDGKLVWLHAASVGEAQSVLTLVDLLLKRYPSLHLLITTGTVTSAALVARSQLPRTVHQFIPVDTPAAVNRFLQHWKPDLALWVESELWPQLLWRSQKRGLPMLLINARMSQQSFEGWKRFPRSIQSLLGCFDAAYAGSTEDAKRLRGLGAKAVHEVGNLKYDAAPLPMDNALLAELSETTAGRRIWVAASTHANEEQMIAELQQTLAKDFPDLLCILVPRHASRGNAIAEDLRARGHVIAQRSKGEAMAKKTSIYLADTMGELGSFYRLAECVFLGGSLVAVGGHNPLEPARLSCALVTGPHIHNFRAIMEHLAAEDALRIAEDKNDLLTVLRTMLQSDALRLAMAERAAALVQEARGASEQITAHIDRLLAARAA